jgi:hypothetical protein
MFPAVVPLGLALACALVWQQSHAAFVAQTATPASQWNAGTVSFGTNSPATALFAASGAKPGSSGAACVKLTYTGSAAATVRMYLVGADLTGTGLGQYLTVQLLEGSGNAADCSDFASAATVYNATGLTDASKTLAAFSAAAYNYATGLGAWAATQNATRTYRINWLLQGNNAAQSLTANATFTWEAQST